MTKKILLASLLFVVVKLQAQFTAPQHPYSFSTTSSDQFQAISPEKIPDFDLQKTLREDRDNPGNRIAAPIPADLGLNNAGQWTQLPNGDRIWQLKIVSSGALGLMALFDDFYLPHGAYLFMYNEKRDHILGAYTQRDNQSNGKFLMGFLKGEVAILEYYEPKTVKDQGRLHLFRIDHAYKKEVFGTGNIANDFGFGAALECQPNINCPEGEEWQTQKRGACRIIIVVEEGIGFCSGNLMNNVRQDGTPYVLSGFHCQDGFTPLFDMYRFDFNFEAPDCSAPAQEPSFNSILGCTRVAGRQENDFILFELSSSIPAEFNAYYHGWDRREDGPTNGTMIHHPVGDIKKISIENDLIRTFNGPISWNNEVTTPPRHHFRSGFDVGTFQVGSSGSALLNQDKRVVGQLHGGLSSCSSDSIIAYFGRLSMSWDGGGTPNTRLRDWLDPDGTDTTGIDGMEMLASGTIAGFTKTEDDRGIAGVVVTLSGSGSPRMMTTGSDGAFSFSEVPLGEDYTISFQKDINAKNGVSTLDIIKAQKHIIGVTALPSPFKIMAGDVNGSDNVSTTDVIRMRRIILGLTTIFDGVESWAFYPADFVFANPADPFQSSPPSVLNITNFSEDLLDINFLGIKRGDLNDSANPME